VQNVSASLCYWDEGPTESLLLKELLRGTHSLM